MAAGNAPAAPETTAMKRPFAVLAIILCAAFLIFSAGAVWWIWSIKQPAIDKTNTAFTRAEQVLDVANKTVGDAKKSLIDSRAGLQTVHQTARAVQAGTKPCGVDSLVARVVAKQLSPNLGNTVSTIDKVTEASIVVHSLLDAVQDVDALHAFDTSQVRNLQEQVGSITKASWELNDILDLNQSSETDEERAARLTARLDAIIRLAADFQKNVEALQTQVQHYRSTTLYWMNLGPKLATFFLVWVAISQIVVIVVAIRAIRMGSPSATTVA
jgi:hypothetical protein